MRQRREALTLTPTACHVDALAKRQVISYTPTFLLPFVGAPIPRAQWQAAVGVMLGLDGINIEADAAAGYADPQVASGYAEFERKRGYQIV